MKLLASIFLGLAFAGTASAQALDCAALQNSPLTEPADYARACGVVAPVPNPSAGNTVNAPTSTAFTLDLRGQTPRPPNTLYSFTLNNFPVQTARGASASGLFGIDFNPAGTTLYGVTGSTGVPVSTFGTVNTTTGAFTAIAPLTGVVAGESTTGLSIHPVSGVAYLSTFGNGISQLYTLNLTTGAATLIGSMGTELMIDIAVNCSGAMYAHGTTTDALFSVNPATGASTLIGAHGLLANFAQGMDFDNEDGTLYAFIYTGAGTNRFGTFNLATGAFTSLSTDNPLGEYEGAIPTQCAGASTAPTLTYNPTTAAGVTFPTGPAGSVNAAIAITSAGATGTGQSAVTGCVITGAGAASFGPVTTTPANGIFNSGTTSGSINLSCTRGGAVATASLSCTETATPTVAGSPFTRTWALTCPAATVPDVAPVGAVAATTLTAGTGSVTPTIVTPAQGTGSTLFACSIPATAPSNFAITSNASQTLGAGAPLPIGLSCAPQAAATQATLTCTQTATPGPNPPNATATITCPAAIAVVVPGITSGSTLTLPGYALPTGSSSALLSFTSNGNAATVNCTTTGAGFAVTPNPLNLATGVPGNVTVTYTGTAVGTFTGSLNCTTTGTGGPFTFPLSVSVSAGISLVAVPAMGTFATWMLVLSALGLGLLAVGTRPRS
jgi:hypothetical protein